MHYPIAVEPFPIGGALHPSDVTIECSTFSVTLNVSLNRHTGVGEVDVLPPALPDKPFAFKILNKVSFEMGFQLDTYIRLTSSGPIPVFIRKRFWLLLSRGAFMSLP